MRICYFFLRCQKKRRSGLRLSTSLLPLDGKKRRSFNGLMDHRPQLVRDEVTTRIYRTARKFTSRPGSLKLSKMGPH